MDGTTNQSGVLALHLGENIGFCAGDHVVGSWRLPALDNHGALAAALIDALSDFAKLHRPTGFILSGRPNETDASVRPDVAVLHIGLLMVVRLFAFRRGYQVEVPSLDRVRETALGQSEFTKAKLKAVVLGFARRRGLSLSDVDAAHALVLWEYSQKVGAQT